MPPKQVYGRRTTSKATATFTTFISPEKNVKPGKNSAKQKAAPAKNEVEGAASELVDCNMDGNKENERKEEAVKESLEKSKRTKKSRADVNVDELAGELIAMKLQNSSELNKTRREKKESRKALGPKDNVIAKKEKANVSAREQITAPQKGAEKQTKSDASSTKPIIRKLQAVVIPSRSPSPPMAFLPTPELTPDVTPEPEDVYSRYVSPILSQSYAKRIVSFDKWSKDLESRQLVVSKIAEASFSEVYRLSAPCSSDSNAEAVLKLVTLKTPPNAPLPSQATGRTTRDPERQAKIDAEAREEKDRWKSGVEDVYSEVKLLQNLQEIPGFTHFREVTVLQGRPTKPFIDAWKAWNKTRPKGKKSEFPDPSKKANYEDTQLWAVVEMQDAGTDCEKVMEAGGLNTIWEVWDVFWGVCLSVAKAEQECRFEHRDLHLENICIRSSRSRSENDLLCPIIEDPLGRKLNFTGLETTVIDYTLSRADVTSSDSSSTPSADLEIAYLDLNRDMGLFTGDATEEYQYEIYRYMRGVVFWNEPLRNIPPTSSSSLQLPQHNPPETPRRSPRKTPHYIKFDENGNPPPPSPRRSPRKSLAPIPSPSTTTPPSIWRSYHPKTNLVWLHFILFKLLEHLQAQGTEPAALTPKQSMRNVDARPEETAKVVKKAGKLYKVLERVGEMLEPDVLAKEGCLGSVGHLVALGIEMRWVRVEDVQG